METRLREGLLLLVIYRHWYLTGKTADYRARVVPVSHVRRKSQ